jgi:7-cyano-7-deazaguanine synthase
MDSTAAMAIAIENKREVVALHFDYRQRTERKEREAFGKVAQFYGAKPYIIDLPFFAAIGKSALTDYSIAVPSELSAKDKVPVTYVPFRNGIFLSIAAAIAEKEGANEIVLGAVEEDSSGYPDCRESFLEAQETAIKLGCATGEIKISAPLVHLTKEQIVREALRLNAPLRLTWSCYQNEDRPCGVCESCRLRQKGFNLAGAKDPIL